MCLVKIYSNRDKVPLEQSTKEVITSKRLYLEINLRWL